jgi:hypothetical protein
LFLALDQSGSGRSGLDREVSAIQRELELSGRRDYFQVETRWAAEPLDVLRELRKLRPTVVHLVGHGASDGLRFQAADGRPQPITVEALGEAFGAAGESVKLVVLRSGYSEAHTEMLSLYIDCVVWLGIEMHPEASRVFAVGFYGGLCECEPVSAAHQQGQAALALVGLTEAQRPQLKVRDGIDAHRVILTT